MPALSVNPPYPIFSDTSGSPLENGYIWIGQKNLEPQANPIAVFWDVDLTIPAQQPIRTIGGYPARNGSPANIFVNSDYSIKILDKRGSLVYSAPFDSERYYATQVSAYYRGAETNVQEALDDISSEIDVINTKNKKNYNWMGFFKTWQNGHAFRVGDSQRGIGTSGVTFARIGFVDNLVTVQHIRGTYQADGVRVQRDNLNANSAAVTLVMNFTQTETKDILGKEICIQMHAKKSASWTGTEINLKAQYSKEQQQPIMRSDGEYTSGNTILAEDDFVITTSMPPEDEPYYIAGTVPIDATQVSIVITIPWSNIAGLSDYIDIEGVFLTIGNAPSLVIPETFNEIMQKSMTRYQTSYPYAAPRGASTKAGAVRVVAVNTSTMSSAIHSVKFSVPMAVVPQVLMQSPLSGTENRWENETTGSFVSGLPYNLSDCGVTLQNNGSVAAGDVLLCHWTALCVF